MSSLDIAAPRRIASLDQFRGYTVVGMLFVNFIGGFVVMPDVLKHHNTYCSYADTIMPQFFFAVGFAFRLTFLKRLETVGQRAAMLASLRRNLGLILVGVVLYHLDGEVKSWEELQKLGLWGFLTTSFTREPFQTLVHIALASLLVTPIIGSRPRVRVVALFAFGLLHLLLSYWFYFEYAWKRPVIDGGPLGFLTWSIPCWSVRSLTTRWFRAGRCRVRSLDFSAGRSLFARSATACHAWALPATSPLHRSSRPRGK